MDSTTILVVSGIVATLLGVGYLFLYERSQARACTWREAAKAVGMTDVIESGSLGMRTGLEGRVEGLSVRIEPYGVGHGGAGTRVLVSDLGHPSWELPARFRVRAEGVESVFSKALGGREVEVGDEALDALAYVQGTPRTILAILDVETRDLLRDLFEGRAGPGGRPSEEKLQAQIALVDGVLQADLPERTGLLATEQLSAAVDKVVALARKLALPDDIPSRLARNVRKDPVPRVRLANLVTLIQQYPDEDVTRESLRAACRDEHAEVRLRAAIALGEEAVGVLKEMASHPPSLHTASFGEESPDSRAARAVEALGVCLTAAEASDILRRSIASRRPLAARAVIGVLGRLGGDEVVKELASVLSEESDDLFVAAARALGDSGGPAAEAPLIAALDRDGPTVWPAVADALGKVGTAEAVAPLRTVAGRYPLDLGLRRASRQAIAQIQSRLSGATPGQLALADGDADAGQLSVIEDATEGRVSMATEGEAAGDAGDDTQWPTDADSSRTSETSRLDEDPAEPSPPPDRRETE